LSFVAFGIFIFNFHANCLHAQTHTNYDLCCRISSKQLKFLLANHISKFISCERRSERGCIERKRMDDLAGSITDGRYKEQKVSCVPLYHILL